MAQFTPGEAIRSRVPTVSVENALEPGVYLFRLVVVDDERNESAPAELRVTVARRIIRPDRIVQPPVRRPATPRRPRGPR